MTFVSTHESANHENQAADKRRKCRQAKRAQIKIREQTSERIVDEQVKIEAECIWEKRENDQIGGIKRLIQDVGMDVFAPLNR